MKLTLAFICQNETTILDEMLQSAKPYVDEIICGWTGTNPETKTILEKYDCKILDLLDDPDCWITLDAKTLKTMKQIDSDFKADDLPPSLIHFSRCRQKTVRVEVVKVRKPHRAETRILELSQDNSKLIPIYKDVV